MKEKIVDQRELQVKEVRAWWNLDRNKKKWDKAYEESDIHSKSYMRLRQKHLLDFVDELGLKKGACVLELGYGGGQTALELGKRGFEVYGLDISEGFAEVATQRCERECPDGKFYLKAGNIESEYEFKDGMFDLVVVLGALQYLYNPYDCLKEVQRVLKPGGHFAVTQRNIYSLSNLTSVRDFMRSCIHFFLRERYEIFASFKSMLTDSRLGIIFGRFADSKFFNSKFMLKRHDTWKYKIFKRLFSYFSLKALLKKAGFSVLKADGAYYCFSENPKYYDFNLKTDEWITRKVKDRFHFLFILGRSVVLLSRKKQQKDKDAVSYDYYAKQE